MDRPPMVIPKKIIVDILRERQKQDKKWGVQHHCPETWLVILMEELGEAAECVCGGNYDLAEYRHELVHVAAVALAAIECLEREAGR